MNVLSSGAGMGMMGTIIWIAVLLVFIFIFMLRPQKKEQARRNEMMAKMAVGDTVLTSSSGKHGDHRGTAYQYNFACRSDPCAG